MYRNQKIDGHTHAAFFPFLIYKELLFFFVLRDIKIRYRNIFITLLWVIFPPLILCLIFNMSLGQLVSSKTHIPYLLFSFSGLILWNYFSSILSRAQSSLQINREVIIKVPFPRIILPLSTIFVGLIDIGINIFFLLMLLLFYSHSIHFLSILVVFPAILLTILMGISFGVLFSVLQVKYKDVRELFPLISSLLFFLTPVIYPVKIVPENMHLFLYLNPLVGAIELLRYGLFPNYVISSVGLFLSFISGSFLCIISIIYFYQYEKELIDIL